MWPGGRAFVWSPHLWADRGCRSVIASKFVHGFTAIVGTTCVAGECSSQSRLLPPSFLATGQRCRSHSWGGGCRCVRRAEGGRRGRRGAAAGCKVAGLQAARGQVGVQGWLLGCRLQERKLRAAGCEGARAGVGSSPVETAVVLHFEVSKLAHGCSKPCDSSRLEPGGGTDECTGLRTTVMDEHPGSSSRQCRGMIVYEASSRADLQGCVIRRSYVMRSGRALSALLAFVVCERAQLRLERGDVNATVWGPPGSTAPILSSLSRSIPPQRLRLT
jgi:hypothetical protein